MTDITEANFQELITDSPLPVLVDVWAPWCRPCKAIAPLVERLARELDGVASVVKLDADAEPDLCQEVNVSNLPTLLVFVRGVEVARKVGTGGGYEGIKSLLTPHLPRAPLGGVAALPSVPPTPQPPEGTEPVLRPPRHQLVRKKSQA